MTEPLPTPEDNELERAKEAAKKPPEKVGDATDLPDDTKDGDVDGPASVTVTGDSLVVTEDDGEA